MVNLVSLRPGKTGYATPYGASPDVTDLSRKIYDAGVRTIAPGARQMEDRFLQNFEDRGLPVGSKAWQKGARGVSQGITDSFSNLFADTHKWATAESGRLFNQNRTARQDWMNELAMILGGQFQPATGLPEPGGTPQIDLGQLYAQEGQRNQQGFSNMQNTLRDLASLLVLA